jgi:hypothetical protein
MGARKLPRERYSMDAPLRPSTRRLLDALARIFERPAWRIFEDALMHFRDSLKPATRMLLERELKGLHLAPPREMVRIEVPAPHVETVQRLLQLIDDPKDQFEINTRNFILTTLEIEEEEDSREGTAE